MATSRQQAERLRKQRERQREYRKRLKAERRPERDDIARVLLHFMIVKAVKSDDKGGMKKLINLILNALKDQGFDEDACLDVLEDLIFRYTKRDWDFRRKVHLSPDGLVDDIED